MITLHRSEDDPFAERIEEMLDELVVAYRTQKYSTSDLKENAPEHTLPFIDENGTIISDREEIKTYLQELQYELDQRRAFTSDACYIDPETGEIC